MENYRFKNFFYRLFQTLGKIFSGKNLLWHALAIVLTFVIVTTGFDWKYYSAGQVAGLWAVALPAIIGGMILPVIVPVVLFLWARLMRLGRLTNSAFALGQAAMLGWFVAAIYKTFTGRPGPENIKIVGDISHVFRFGFYRGGIFWGWPSTHTTVAFAMALALFTLYPKNKIVRGLAIAYALYIGLSISFTIHWFSDFVAGAIFGSLVGLAVGRSFLAKLKK